MATTGLVSHFVAMAGNNAWSNHRLLGACKELTAEEFSASAPASSRRCAPR